MTQKEDIKRVQVTFTKEQWELIERFKGTLGQTDAEIVRNIVISWLSEKSVITTKVKKEISKR
jgi:predicted transcriptional regulator